MTESNLSLPEPAQVAADLGDDLGRQTAHPCRAEPGDLYALTPIFAAGSYPLAESMAPRAWVIA